MFGFVWFGVGYFGGVGVVVGCGGLILGWGVGGW